MEILRNVKPHLVKDYGATQLGMFGSATSADFKDSSDVDLLIEFTNYPGFNFFEINNFLEKSLGRKVDILTQAGFDSIRYEEIKDSIRTSLIYV